jgi:hypothetical protein
MPGARCARSLACKIKKHTSIVTTVTPGSPGIPHAMVLTVSFVLSPVIGLVCHRRKRSCLRQLDASVEASGPHDFAVRLTCHSSKAPSASTASRPAFVTIASRPSIGTRRPGYNFDLGETAKGIFLQMRVDRPNHVDPLQQNSVLVKTPVCPQDSEGAVFAEGINARCATGRLGPCLHPVTPVSIC